MYQGGPAHRGTNPLAEGPGEDLEVRWTAEVRTLVEGLDDGLAETYLSPPVVRGDRVYAALCFTGRDQSGFSLVALSTEDGSVDWHTEITDSFGWAGRVFPQPAIVDDTIVVANPDFQEVVPMLGVDAETGDIEWRYEGEHVPVTPVTVNDGSYVAASRGAFALADDDRSQRWVIPEGEDRPRARVGYPPTVGDDRVYVPLEETVYAVDSVGSEIWTREIGSETKSEALGASPYTPVVGDSVYVASGYSSNDGDGRLLALDPEDGSTEWEFTPDVDAEKRAEWTRESTSEGTPYPVATFSTPALADGTLYAPGFELPDEQGQPLAYHLYAVDAASGTLTWKAPLPANPRHCPPVVADGTVYIEVLEELVAIDAASGDLVASVRGPAEDVGGMAVVDDRLYASYEATLLAVGPA